MKKIIQIIIVAMLLSLVFAPLVSGMEWDNKFSYDETEDIVTVKNWLGLGETLGTIQKLENTDRCYTNCYTIWKVNSFSDTDAFLKDVIFKNPEGETENIPYKFESGEITEEIIDVFETQCSPIIAKNSSPVSVCQEVKTGTRIAYSYKNWQPVDTTQKIEGEYIIKMSGTKAPAQSVDWQPDFYGAGYFDTWAWWYATAPDFYSKHEGDGTDASGNGNDLGSGGTIANVTGHLNQGAGGDLNNANYMRDASYTAMGTQDLTWVFGLKADGASGIDMFMGSATNWIEANQWIIGWNTGGIQELHLLQGNSINIMSNASLLDNTWHRVILTRDYSWSGGNTNWTWYIDGEINASMTAGDYDLSVTGLKFDGASGNADCLGCWVDDFALYNAIWDGSDVTTDYNSGAWREADELVDTGAPNVDITSPTNNTITTDSELDILIAADDDIAITSQSWSINAGEINTSMDVGANITNITWDIGTHNVTVYVNDAVPNYNSTMVNFNIFNLDIELNQPENETNSTTGDITFEANLTASSGITGAEVYLNGISNTSIQADGETGLNISQLIEGIEDGMSQTWAYFANDSDNNNAISVNRTFNVDGTLPEVNIITPLNNSNSSNPIVDINATISDATSGVQTVVYSNDSGLFNTTLTYGENITEQNWGSGTTTVIIWAIDFLGNSNFDAVTFTVDLFGNITFNQPENNTITNVANQNLSVNISDDLGIKNATLHVFNDSGLVNETDVQLSDNPLFATVGVLINLLDGAYKWFYSMFDIDEKEVSQTENRTITVDATPPELDIVFPVDGSRITQDMALSPNTTIEINMTISDTNLESCYLFNGTANQSITCGDNFTSSLVYDTYEFIFFANDSFNNGDSVTSTVIYDFGIRENNQSFPYSTIEGNMDIFVINITTNGSQPSIVNLNYNNTDFLASTIANIGDNNYSITRTLQIPSIEEDVNVTFFWDINLQDGTSGNSSKNNVSVFALAADDCTTNNVLILNYTHRDEDTQTLISNDTNANNTVEINVNVFPVDSTESILNFTANFSSSNPQVCLVPDFSNSTEYRMDATVRYDTEDHVSEFNIIRNFVLTNDTIPQNIDLFDLLNTRSQEFLLTYKDDNFLPQGDVIIDVTRNYISEGTFKTVEKPITDDLGQTLVHLVLSDVLYTLFAKDSDGNVLAVLDNFVAVCEQQGIGNCRISMNKIATTVNPEDFSTLGDISATETFDLDTRTVSVIFTVIGGGVKTVSINTTLFDRFGNQTVCTDSLTSSSGTLNCVIPQTFGNQTVESKIFSDGILVGNSRRDLEDPSDNFGTTGVIVALMLFWIIVMMFITSTVGIVIGAIVAMFLSLSMFLFSGGNILGAGSAFVFVLVAAFIIIWRVMKSESPA
jgi:hypothetical protein